MAFSGTLEVKRKIKVAEWFHWDQDSLELKLPDIALVTALIILVLRGSGYGPA